MTDLPPVLLIGAGKMGAALFGGWCRAGLLPSAVVDPSPTPGLVRAGDVWCATMDGVPPGFAPSVAVLAIKPQMAPAVLPALSDQLPAHCLVLSIMAGVRTAALAACAAGRPVVRAMPNMPAAIGEGMTVAFASPGVDADQLALCTRLLATVGEVAWIDDEALLDPVTAVSGSGPAYLFLLAEILEQAAAEQGIPALLARQLARRTVSGAGALLAASPQDAATLRRAVTSPGGTTEQALAVLMDPAAWPHSIRAAVAAAARRSRELSSGPGLSG
jgi:pyrroline-5-carboxylate reductase